MLHPAETPTPPSLRPSPKLKSSSDDCYRDAKEQRRTEPSSRPSPRHKSSSDDRYWNALERGRTERKHTPHHRDISDSEKSTFSSKSLGSDLRHMINQLHKQYREQNQDTRRGCHRCGSKPHGREDCPARFKVCHFCKCIGHLKAMCPTVPG